jgi:hypothetical protein
MPLPPATPMLTHATEAESRRKPAGPWWARRLRTACHDDTHKRHQHAWTLLYSAGPWGAPRPRPWTVLDNLAMLCKQGFTGSVYTVNPRNRGPYQTDWQPGGAAQYTEGCLHRGSRHVPRWQAMATITKKAQRVIRGLRPRQGLQLRVGGRMRPPIYSPRPWVLSYPSAVMPGTGVPAYVKSAITNVGATSGLLPLQHVR